MYESKAISVEEQAFEAVLDLFIYDPEINASTSKMRADYTSNLWNPNMKKLGVSSCGFMEKKMSMAQRLGNNSRAAVFDYADKYYELNKKGKDKIAFIAKNPPLRKCKAGRRLAQRENKTVLDLNKASQPFAVSSAIALGLGAILSL